LRFIDPEGDRLVVINLGCDLDFTPAREPLLAPPAGARWTLAWSSESPRYGGQGTPELDPDTRWLIPGGCALMFTPVPREHESDAEPDADD
jgi:maltooligosyltrehalose trehalohydrolase